MSFSVLLPCQDRRHGQCGWTGVDMSTPLLPEVVPGIYANPVSFYRMDPPLGLLRLQTPIIGSRSVLAMCVHPTFFDLTTSLCVACVGFHRYNK